ncbi:hypothetical protein [Aurantiacibacter sp. MUD61]|uniref:hypothetical protein n=1 Tax=Aurantiacibacter sp. MUD61 TaxID=3009083 RepID=UPI0022EFE360|nr:hypothetical protein [Aurantiacibacter sp. MUD61]
MTLSAHRLPDLPKSMALAPMLRRFTPAMSLFEAVLQMRFVSHLDTPLRKMLAKAAKLWESC